MPRPGPLVDGRIASVVAAGEVGGRETAAGGGGAAGVGGAVVRGGGFVGVGAEPAVVRKMGGRG